MRNSIDSTYEKRTLFFSTSRESISWCCAVVSPVSDAGKLHATVMLAVKLKSYQPTPLAEKYYSILGGTFMPIDECFELIFKVRLDT